jgi:hypothetical protein
MRTNIPEKLIKVADQIEESGAAPLASIIIPAACP